jgi:hypothetical protein
MAGKSASRARADVRPATSVRGRMGVRYAADVVRVMGVCAIVAGCGAPAGEASGTSGALPSVVPTTPSESATSATTDAPPPPAPEVTHACTVEVVARGATSYRSTGETTPGGSAPYRTAAERDKEWARLRAQAWKKACADLERAEHRRCEPVDCVGEKRVSLMPNFETLIPYSVTIELRPGVRARGTGTSTESVEAACVAAEKVACAAGCEGGTSRVAVDDAAVPYECPVEHKPIEMYRRSKP